MSDKMREEFEAWIKTEFDGCMPRRKGKGYLSQYVNGAWKAWKSSRAARCSNACAGMEDPAAEIAELKRQRDELLVALSAAIPLIKKARLDWCNQNAESYDEDVVTPYDAILYSPALSLLENKGSAS